MSWLVDINIVSWTLLLNLSGLLTIVTVTQGARDRSGRYIKTAYAAGLMLALGLFSYYVFNPFLRNMLLSISSGDQTILLILAIVAYFGIYFLIKRSWRRRRHT